MAYRRTRRRKKYTWFPTHGTAITRTGQTEFVANPVATQFSVGPGVDVAHNIIPLVLPDYPVEDNFADQTLNDVVGNEYVVERIVGNAYGFGWLEGTVGGQVPGAFILGMGIFVARADGNDPTGPAGSQGVTTEEASRNFNPLELQTIREPWMFRRTWVLSLAGANTVNTNLATLTSPLLAVDERFASAVSFPKSTVMYTGLHTGPFIDVKSVRRIRQDERLWAVWAAMPFPMGYGGANPTFDAFRVHCTFDYRVLGALRRSKNRSNF